MASAAAPLPQSVGYVVVLGLGFLFAVVMNVITWLQAKYSKFSPSNASEFTAASRSLKTGIVVAGIISSCKPAFINFLFQNTTHLINLFLIITRDMELDTSSECYSVL